MKKHELDQMTEDMGECFTLRVKSDVSTQTTTQAVDRDLLLKLDMLRTIRQLVAFQLPTAASRSTPVVEESYQIEEANRVGNSSSSLQEI